MSYSCSPAGETAMPNGELGGMRRATPDAPAISTGWQKLDAVEIAVGSGP